MSAVNNSNGLARKGYDPVAYFTDRQPMFENLRFGTEVYEPPKSRAAAERTIQVFELEPHSEVVLDSRHARRRLVSLTVTNNPTAERIAGQVTDRRSPPSANGLPQ